MNIHRLFILAALATFSSLSASAAMVTYDTSASFLLCGFAANCTQVSPDQLRFGDLNITYSPTVSTVNTPSIINLGNITTSGQGSAFIVGTILHLTILSTPPGASGSIHNGTILGGISTNQSGLVLTFAPRNTTTQFGHLPGVVIGDYTYQVLNPVLGLQAPTVGNPPGQTTIQGDVVGGAVPEPGMFLMLGMGLVLLALRNHIAQRKDCEA